MMPDQALGSCMALEDAAALDLIFREGFQSSYSVEAGLKLYELLRKARATRVQTASLQAREDVNERIGFRSSSERPGKLTIEEVWEYNMQDHLMDLATAS